MKIYTKKGSNNYREKKLISEIEEAIFKDPNKAGKFKKSATNFDELKALHTEICSQEVTYTDMPDKGEPKVVKAEKQEAASEPSREVAERSDDNFTDPFNREEPIVRDYVLTDELKKNKTDGQKEEPTKTTFEEPVTFDESFSMPDDGAETQKDGKNTDKKEPKKDKPGKSEPVNPDFNNMSGSKKRKQTEKFVRKIVTAISALQEKGFVWFANKDINDAKLVEYELAKEMDLSVLVTLEDGQEVTVKEFFQAQCKNAETLAKIDKDDQEDFIQSLTEVFLEKGIAPTPMQQCLLDGATIIAKQGLNLLALKEQTSSILTQLRAMGKPAEDVQHTEVKQEKKEEPPTPPTEPVQEPDKPKPTTPQSTEVATIPTPDDGELIEGEIPTKE